MMSMIEALAKGVVDGLIRGGMVTEANRLEAEKKSVEALLARELPDDVGADWRKLHQKG